MRYSLLTATDQIIFMFQRRVADLWHHCADGVASVDWAQQYHELLQELSELAAHDAVPDTELRSRLREMVAARRAQRPPSRASVIRQRLIDAVAPVRSLLVRREYRLPWQATGEHPALDALNTLRAGYAAGIKRLPSEVTAPRLGAAWRAAIADPDRERAFRALEVATLLALRRAVRNGSVWIEHSLSFRGRQRLFLPRSVGRPKRGVTTPGCGCQPRPASSSYRYSHACAPVSTRWRRPPVPARCAWTTSCTWPC
jgi:hypothetical protein